MACWIILIFLKSMLGNSSDWHPFTIYFGLYFTLFSPEWDLGQSGIFQRNLIIHAMTIGGYQHYGYKIYRQKISLLMKVVTFNHGLSSSICKSQS